MENRVAPAEGHTVAAFDALFDDPDDRWLAQMAARRAGNEKWAKPGDHVTKLPPPDEAKFRAWVAQQGVPFNPDDPIADYDMRGFYQGLTAGDPEAQQAPDANDIDPATGRARLHFPDKWKTPYHETFSRDSQYALPNAPYWLDDQYLVSPEGKPLFNDKAPR